ncbi:MAG: TetR/AcrR family transcriptional regulator [Pseudomonadota bacterium]|nr:TetR/AcrR family transcriptional regulator [Pseudomonadota bacterium]
MADKNKSTKERIIGAANSLFYMAGIRATSVDAIAAKAGITKRSLYYHFQSKDELIAEYLGSRDQLNLNAYKKWFAAQEGDVSAKLRALFNGILETTSHPKWRGCGFQRTVGELANKPGHPAIRVASLHKKKVEQWLAEEFCHNGLVNADVTARHVFLLLEGAMAAMLVHRDPAYIRQAAEAAALLVSHAAQSEDC